jgi:hypothetical protein
VLLRSSAECHISCTYLAKGEVSYFLYSTCIAKVEIHDYIIIIGCLLSKIVLLAMAPGGTVLAQLAARHWNVHVQFTGLGTDVTVDWIN